MEKAFVPTAGVGKAMIKGCMVFSDGSCVLLICLCGLKQVAAAPTLDESTRQLAAEFLVTLCEAREKAPGMMRKLNDFPQQLFQVLISFLLDIEVRRGGCENEYPSCA